MTAHKLARSCGLGPIPYYSFGLSRTLALAGVAVLDGTDWHKAGSEQILQAQQPDGSWYLGDPEGTDVLETCWSLLFLARATVPAVP